MLTPRERLEQCLRRFGEAAVAGDDAGALRAFGDAQAAMPLLADARVEALRWVEEERRVVQLLPASVDALTDKQARAALARARKWVAS